MTQTELKSMSIPVDALADQALAQYREHQQREQQRQTEQIRQKDQQAITVLQALLATEIETDLLATWSPTYEVRHDSYGSTRTEATFSYAGVNWHLSQDSPNRYQENWRWSIRATNPDYGYNSQISDLTTNAAPQALRITLLLKIGERRQQQRREQQRLQTLAHTKAVKEREEQERTEQIAQADQEDARWREQIATLKQQEKERLWHWSASTAIVIYRITYNTGVGRGDEDEVILEQGSAWTGTDCLDNEGYIRLESKRSSWGETRPREIKLDAATHMPTWERIIVGSVEELAEELREEIRVSIPHVCSRRDYDLDGISRLTSIGDESPYSELVGLRPLAWVRTKVDQATKKTNEPEHNSTY